MAEIDRARIKSIYAQIKGYFDNLPEFNAHNPYAVDMKTVENYHTLLDQLSEVSRTNYGQHKIDPREQMYHRYELRAIKSSMGAVISRLEVDYGLKELLTQNNQAAIVINNQNSNTIDININFTIENLIENATTDEEKGSLSVISEEIKKPEADWGRLSTALGWILNYSKELSLKVLPIVLDYYLKRGN